MKKAISILAHRENKAMTSPSQLDGCLLPLREASKEFWLIILLIE